MSLSLVKEEKMSSFDEESMEDRTAETSVAEVVVEGAYDDASVPSEVPEKQDDDTAGQADVESMVHDDDDENTTVKTEQAEDEASIATSQADSAQKQPAKKKRVPPKSKKTRSPAVKGLTIPFRSVKRTMKLDPSIATVQQEAAIITTLAAELFLKSLAKEAHQNAKSRGRGTIR